MIPIGSGWWGKSQEQDDRGQTIMTAFILSRAPLMVAGKMPLDDKSLQYLTNPLALKIHADTKEPHGVEYQGNCTSPGNTIPRDYFPAHPCVQIWAKANLAKVTKAKTRPTVFKPRPRKANSSSSRAIAAEEGSTTSD